MTLKNQHGFSLLELMIALAVLSVGILAIAQMQITAVRGNADAMEHTDFSAAVQTQTEIFINANFTSISNAGASTADGYTVVAGNTDLYSLPGNHTLEYRVISWSDLDSDGTNDLMGINLRVRDNGDNQTKYTITLYKNGGVGF